MKTFGLVIICAIVTLSQTGATAMERFEIVTTKELYELMTKKKAGTYDFLLINTLDELIHNHHSIPESVNIPWSTIEESPLLQTLDKRLPLITYCMGYR